MDLMQLLAERELAIIDAASTALGRSRLTHYNAGGNEWIEACMRRLFELTRRCIASRDLQPMLDYATELAHERYEGGYGLQEVTAAVNLLEEAIWREISSRLEPQRFPEAFGLVSTVLGNTKTRLAVEYVALASRQHAPSLDLDRLFRGTN